MARWQCDLSVSWTAQWVSLLLHGVIILILLLFPGTDSHPLIWIVLLILVMMESVRSQRRILTRVGAVELDDSGQVKWRQQQWRLAARPWQSRWMILLSLRNHAGKREKLWLCFDSMEPAQWRTLHQHLLMQLKRQ